MDITALALDWSSAKLQNQVATQVLSMSMDDSKALGEQMAKTLELSVNPSVGSNFDVSV